MVLYILCGSVDDGINKDFVLITPALVTLGISYEYRDALLSSEKKDCARATIFIIFWSFIISVLYIFNFVQYENSWIVLTCLILCTTTFVSCKMIYYFSFLGIDKKKIKPLEISATSLFNISKIGIPAGILVHTWRMSRLLPTRDYKMFLLDLTKCDNRSALQIIISSIISFGVVIPIQAIAIPNISFLEYTLYSTFPSIVFSNNYARIGFAIAVVIALYKRQLAYKNIKEAEIHLVSIN
ncbi:transmembrane domain-containing protein [Cryptosporidium canis]|uniref:Transmembrane domain-containing protein n=1 Tax=Cryptosporidium canis TaxID=195482 RepID=A0ABQ8PC78_9CRYT|nr:transmembrane domain-containing protein [Cryptosporidium canis]KAJ1615287.1 transmembrane domain-containing protein [Cryptosporidium canis]